MKFFSKFGNLRVVLKPGTPAEPITGRIAVPGMYVRFENGVANVANEQMIVMMKAHPQFNIDFVCDEENPQDPYASTRKDTEPEHILTDLKYGSIEKRTVENRPTKLSPELAKLIEDRAVEIAKGMITQIMDASAAKQAEATPVVKSAVKKPVKKTPSKKPVNKPVEKPIEPIVNNEQ